MSSATSIDRTGGPEVAPKPGNTSQRDVFHPWHFFVLASLLAATAAVILARQSSPEHLVLISLTIGAAGFAAAALHRTLLPLVSRDAARFDEPVTGSTRAALEREKMLVLRAIKDLEFDRAMGKVSPADFEEMAGRLRSRAMTLIRQLDAEGGYRELIERELNARLGTRAAKRVAAGRRETAADANPPATAPAAPGESAAAATSPDRTCACGTRNDPDAAFCKRCGARLAAAAAR